jgi:nucleotide-binding universal stress UspA family protein
MDAATIIAAYDPSSPDQAPVRFAAAAARATGAPLVVVHVHGGLMTDWRADGEVHEPLGEHSAQALEHLRLELPAVEFRTLEANTAARGIHRALEEYDAALAVVGATARGAVGRLTLGSTAERVIHGAPCPVAVVPRGYEVTELKAIGAAFVRSGEGREALRAAAGLARTVGARLRVLTVLKDDPGDVAGAHPSTTGTRLNQDREDAAMQQRAAAEEELADRSSALARDLEVEAEVMFGSPADVLADVSRHLDLLIMGSRAYGPQRAVLLGGVSRRVVAAAACPVLVLPRGVRRPLDRLVADQRMALG